MKRVEKGSVYWAVYLLGKEPIAICYKENGCTEDFGRFSCGNYFATKEEAEQMARKIRAVLAGADVVQIPSEEEIEDAMKTSITESIFSGSPYGQFTQRATDLLECAWMKGIEWLKSKTIK